MNNSHLKKITKNVDGTLNQLSTNEDIDLSYIKLLARNKNDFFEYYHLTCEGRDKRSLILAKSLASMFLTL